MKATWRSRATWRRIFFWRFSDQRIWRREAKTQMQAEREEQMGLRRTLNPASTLFTRVRNVIKIVNVLLFSPFSFLSNFSGTMRALGLAMKPQLDLRRERSICRGHLSDWGVHCYTLLPCAEGINSLVGGGSTNAFIVILRVIIIDPLWLLFEGCPSLSKVCSEKRWR